MNKRLSKFLATHSCFPRVGIGGRAAQQKNAHDPNRAPQFQHNCPLLKLVGTASLCTSGQGAFRSCDFRR